MPGALEFIHQIAPSLPNAMAIVTSASDEEAHAFIERNGVARYFADGLVIGQETIIAEQLKQKPEPDPYLLAMRRIGVTAGVTVAYDDTPPGVESAKKAGEFVFGCAFSKLNVALLRDESLAYPPDVIIESFSEGLALLGLGG
jgi:HAD superfamily hydrolase (TIGR01509 family)